MTWALGPDGGNSCCVRLWKVAPACLRFLEIGKRRDSLLLLLTPGIHLLGTEGSPLSYRLARDLAARDFSPGNLGRGASETLGTKSLARNVAYRRHAQAEQTNWP
jgi:hypothetical protein